MKRRLFRITALSVVAMVTLVLSFARAQQPTPSTAGPLEKAPHGWNQADWNIFRGHCLQLNAEMQARRKMTPAQLHSLPPFTMQDLQDAETCGHQMMRVPMGSVTPSKPAPGVAPPPPPLPPPPPAPPPPPGASSISPSAPSGSSLGPFLQKPGAAGLSACSSYYKQPLDVAYL